MLSGYGDRFGLLTRHEFDYKSDMEAYFEPYRDHAAVALFDTLSSRGFAFDRPPTTMLYLSYPPELEPQALFTDELVASAGGPERMNEFLQALREFARESDFINWYDGQAPAIAEILTQTERTTGGEDYVATIESYFGMRQNSYHIVLAPLYHPGGFWAERAAI
jgi:hypothetical protein